jgi:hypothetical protein
MVVGPDDEDIGLTSFPLIYHPLMGHAVKHQRSNEA